MTISKTSLGGAISTFGKSLIGLGILPQLSGVPSKALTYLALAGFIVEGIGQGVTSLFAADAKKVKSMGAQVQENSEAIVTGDTTMLTRRAAGVASGVIPPTDKTGP